MMHVIALVLGLAIHGCFSAQMDVVHSWRGVDFNFPNNAARDAMMRTGKFIPANIAIVDVDVWEAHDGATQKIIVTMPRFKPGTPATLASVGLTGLLTPYPDWEWHREGNCDGITSVFRIEVDQCGRLWVLDSGTVEIFEQEPKMICPPQILVFDMNTDKLIARYRFPADVLDPKSLLVTIVVDTRDSKCQNTFAYVADVVSFKLIVFDAKNQKSWRVSNNYFYPYPLHGSFDIAGVNFDLMDGILGPMVKGDRRLYFHSLASVRESWVSTSVLQNSTHFTDGDGSPRSFHVSAYTRPSQSAAQAMTKSGILFFGLLSQNSIACWNSRLSYTKDNIITVAKDNTKLQFPTGVKIRNGYLWVLTSRFQNFITGVFDKFNANFRILVASLDVLTHGTSCHYPSDGPLYNSPSIYNQSAIWSPFDHYIFYK